MEKETDERLKSLTMRIHMTEELVTNMKQQMSAQTNSVVPTGDPGTEPVPDVTHQVKV